MKIYFSKLPQSKDQTEMMNKLGVENRLVSYWYIDKQIRGNRKKILSKKVHELWEKRPEEE